jgi:hypothetical protein
MSVAAWIKHHFMLSESLPSKDAKPGKRLRLSDAIEHHGCGLHTYT